MDKNGDLCSFLIRKWFTWSVQSERVKSKRKFYKPIWFNRRILIHFSNIMTLTYFYFLVKFLHSYWISPPSCGTFYKHILVCVPDFLCYIFNIIFLYYFSCLSHSEAISTTYAFTKNSPQTRLKTVKIIIYLQFILQPSTCRQHVQHACFIDKIVWFNINMFCFTSLLSGYTSRNFITETILFQYSANISYVEAEIFE